MYVCVFLFTLRLYVIIFEGELQYKPSTINYMFKRMIQTNHLSGKIRVCFKNNNPTNHYDKALLLVKFDVALMQTNHISGKNLVCFQK